MLMFELRILKFGHPHPHIISSAHSSQSRQFGLGTKRNRAQRKYATRMSCGNDKMFARFIDIAHASACHKFKNTRFVPVQVNAPVSVQDVIHGHGWAVEHNHKCMNEYHHQFLRNHKENLSKNLSPSLNQSNFSRRKLAIVRR